MFVSGNVSPEIDELGLYHRHQKLIAVDLAAWRVEFTKHGAFQALLYVYADHQYTPVDLRNFSITKPMGRQDPCRHPENL